MTVTEAGVYPRKWGEFIGQDLAKEQIRLAARSAKKRRRPMPHMLFAHPDGGVGKTALAKLAAQEMNTRVLEISGDLPMLRARRLFVDLEDGDIVFWDEIHQGRKHLDWTLPFLADGHLPGPFGPEPVAAITILAATTELDQLPIPVVDRFQRPPLIGYTLAEAARIAQVMARRILVTEGLPPLNKKEALTLAGAGNSNPRAILRLLSTLRDVAVVHGMTPSGYDLDRVFRFHGLTEDGLDQIACRYLTVLHTEFQAGAGLQALAERLMEPSLAEVERVLMDKGLIGKTSRGRTLTAAGMKRAKELLAA